ncbi:MAG: cdr [Holophagaceae bacterium]|nr:cdr [Holophagaceae bacterium]
MSRAPRIVIVGGVAGGASAAARARRLSEEAEIILLERGPQVSFANCGLPYHLGGVIPERSSLLVQTPERLRARFALDVRVRSEVTAIDPGRRSLNVKNLETGESYQQSYDALVLSPGAAPIRPPLPGIDDPRVFTLRNLEDMDGILAALPSEGQGRVLIVGAGYIGLELAESFRHRGLEVCLLERLPHVLGVADADMVAPLQAELRRNGVDLRLGISATAFGGCGDQLLVRLEGGESLSCDLAILCVGVRPETRLAQEAGLALGSTGGILVDDQMRTSDPHIFAVGDAIEVRDFVSEAPALIPLAGPANRQGRIAAEVILGRDSRYKGTQGTAVCKVFNLTFAMTGMTEAALQRRGMSFRKIYIYPPQHATYYPGAQPMSLKLLFEPDLGRILGAQAVGPEGVDKRIDVLAVAQRAGLTVLDLEDLELCYAPPFGSAKDPINMAGFVAANVLRGDVDLWEPEELSSLAGSQLLLDVRSPAENANGSIPEATCIPVDTLRARLAELPRDKEILVFCQVGLRGYLAARILAQHGYRVRNLSGGYRRYQQWQATHIIR